MITLFRKPVGTAAESWGFFLNAGSSIICTWQSGTDAVNLQVLVDSQYVNVLAEDGVTPITITPATPQHIIRGAATYRVTAGTGSDITATANQGI